MPAMPRRSLCARGAARGARPRIVCRPVAVGVRPDGLRHLPRSAPRFRSRPTRSPSSAAARTCASRACARCRRSRYLQAVPQFTEHYYESEDEGDDSIDNGPTGGLTWDGRVDRGRDQARIPLVVALRNGQRQRRALVAPECAAAGHAEELRKIFGAAIFDDTEKAFAGDRRGARSFPAGLPRVLSLQQQVRRLSRRPRRADRAGSARARAVQRSGKRAIAAIVIAAQRGKDGTPPQFTDYGLIALGVPRNRDIPPMPIRTISTSALCGPLRTDPRRTR